MRRRRRSEVLVLRPVAVPIRHIAITDGQSWYEWDAGQRRLVRSPLR